MEKLLKLAIIGTTLFLASCFGGGGGDSQNNNPPREQVGEPTNPVPPMYGDALEGFNLVDLNDGVTDVLMDHNGVAIKLDPNSDQEYILIEATIGTIDGDGNVNHGTDRPFRVLGLDSNGILTDFTETKSSGDTGSQMIRRFLVADFNDDGLDDVFLDNHGTEYGDPYPGEQNFLFINDGTGVLVNRSDDLLPNLLDDYSHMSSYGDMDGDQLPDIWVNNFNVTDPYLLINSSAGFSSPHYFDLDAHSIELSHPDNSMSDRFNATFPGGQLSSPNSSAVMDLDRDGDNDIMLFELGIGGEDTQVHLINDGSGTFVAEFVEKMTNSRFAEESETGDINGDGFNEVITVGTPTDEPFGAVVFTVFESSSNGVRVNETAIPDLNFSANGTANQGWLVDIDADSDLDIFFATQLEGQSSFPWRHLLLLNDGNGNFSEVDAADYNLDFEGYKWVFADLDGDGDKDVVFEGPDAGSGNILFHKLNLTN